jgi:hypothetical protein
LLLTGNGVGLAVAVGKGLASGEGVGLGGVGLGVGLGVNVGVAVASGSGVEVGGMAVGFLASTRAHATNASAPASRTISPRLDSLTDLVILPLLTGNETPCGLIS